MFFLSPPRQEAEGVETGAGGTFLDVSTGLKQKQSIWNRPGPQPAPPGNNISGENWILMRYQKQTEQLPLQRGNLVNMPPV